MAHKKIFWAGFFSSYKKNLRGNKIKVTFEYKYIIQINGFRKIIFSS